MEDSVLNLVKVFSEELENISSRRSDSAESHQAFKEFNNIMKPHSLTHDKQSSREVEQEPLDISRMIFARGT